MKIKWDKDAADKVAADVADGVKAVAITVQSDVRKRLGSPGTGRVYKGHQASAPGEPPAVRTGTLRRSIQIDLSGLSNKRNPSVRVGTNLAYARYLEFGTRIMAARPFMRPSLAAVRMRAPKIMAPYLRRALMKVGVA